MGKRYNQLTERERSEIYRLRLSGHGPTAIGRAIGRNKGTISRELQRNACGESREYLAVTAERTALSRRHQKRVSKIERSSQLADSIRENIVAMGWSPEQIAGRLEREHGTRQISHESIYRFVYSAKGRSEGLHRALPQAKKKRGRRVRTKDKPLIPNLISIHDRPKAVEDRQEFGHWEGDLMAFSLHGHYNAIVAERLSRFMQAAQQEDKTAATTTDSLKSFFEPLPDTAKKSIIYDRGGEFTKHQDIDVPAFFCDPHSPWQKGGVENSIGRLRRDLPRKTTLTDYSDADLQDIIDAHNHTPRKCLAYKTPAEVFFANLHQSVALEL